MDIVKNHAHVFDSKGVSSSWNKSRYNSKLTFKDNKSKKEAEVRYLVKNQMKYIIYIFMTIRMVSKKVID